MRGMALAFLGLLGPRDLGGFVVLGQVVEVFVELLHALLVRHLGFLSDPFSVLEKEEKL